MRSHRRLTRRKSPSPWRLAALLVLLGCLAASSHWPTVAAAQPTVPETGDDDDHDDADADEEDANDTGYIGGPTLTPEVDRCKRGRSSEGATQQQAASEHYQRGTALYVQGDYAGAIEEFVAGYCDQPNYLMLSNIAKSYERLLDYEKAVAYLSRTLLEMPKGDPGLIEQTSFRIQVMSRLPAQVRVATVPAGARITLTGDTGVNARGFSDDKKAISIQKGSYELRVELEGYEPVTQSIAVEIGKPYSYYFRLEPKRGTVRVTASPSTSRIFIDKRLVGIGSYVERLAIGRHTITVEANGRTAQSRTVDVTANQTSSINVPLPAPAASGRRQLLIASTAVGGLFGGATFATVFGEGGPEATLGGLVGLGIGFGGAYFGVPRRISVGRSSYIIGTTLIGAGQGAAIAHFFACDTDIALDADANADCRKVVSNASLAAGVGGLFFGAVTADNFELDAGDAALVNSGAQWGLIGGLLFVAAFDNDRRLLSPFSFAGLNVGVLAGALVARRMEVSRGHVALIDVSGLAGMIAGVALVDVVQPGQRSERVPHFALLGMTAGLITGAYLTRNMEEPDSVSVRTLEPSMGKATDASGRLTTTFGFSGHF